MRAVLEIVATAFLAVSPPIHAGGTTAPEAPRVADAASPFERAIGAGREVMKELMARTPAPGMAVAVATGERVVWEEGFGVADLETRAAMTPATRLGLGSISKSLTMALAGRLVDEGAFDLDRPIESWLPGFPHAGKGITPRLIAGHLSGLDDAYATAHWTGTTHFETTSAALAEIFKEKLLSEPGTSHFYATGSYTLIAGAIEKAAGLPFLAAMQRKVLDPLRLESVVPNDPTRPVPGTTVFYLAGDDGKPLRAPAFDPSHKWAGAGYLSTAGDLARFGAAMMKPGFLTEATLRQIFTPLKTRAGVDTGFGLGWRIGQRSGPGMTWIIGPDDSPRRIVHQPGGGPGISSWLVLDLDAQVAVGILSNMTGAPAGGRHLDAILEAFTRASTQARSAP